MQQPPCPAAASMQCPGTSHQSYWLPTFLPSQPTTHLPPRDPLGPMLPTGRTSCRSEPGAGGSGRAAAVSHLHDIISTTSPRLLPRPPSPKAGRHCLGTHLPPRQPLFPCQSSHDAHPIRRLSRRMHSTPCAIDEVVCSLPLSFPGVCRRTRPPAAPACHGPWAGPHAGRPEITHVAAASCRGRVFAALPLLLYQVWPARKGTVGRL